MSGEVIDNVTAQLVNEGVGTKAALDAVAELLVGSQASHTLDPRVVATNCTLSLGEVEPVLDGYARHGILARREMIECSACATLAPAEEVRQARHAGDDYPCPGPCETDLTEDDRAEPVHAYLPIETDAR